MDSNNSSLVELLHTLITGNQVQLKQLHNGEWLSVRLSVDQTCFEAHYKKLGWRPIAIGGSGPLEWRYPPTEGAFVG